jgi:hypothetical protein
MKATFSFALLAFVLAACGDDPGALTNGGSLPGAPDPGAVNDPGDPALCKSREYVGFDKKALHSGREVIRLGMNRSRVKPYSALSSEYPRVLGNTPASLAAASATFAQPPARWYEEPQANAVAIQTAYNIAFDGCLGYTGSAPEFAAAPDPANAEALCGSMARKFWSKTPAPQELTACADVALKGAAGEPQSQRKWAYACASVLTSAGFLTY